VVYYRFHLNNYLCDNEIDDETVSQCIRTSITFWMLQYALCCSIYVTAVSNSKLEQLFLFENSFFSQVLPLLNTVNAVY